MSKMRMQMSTPSSRRNTSNIALEFLGTAQDTHKINILELRNNVALTVPFTKSSMDLKSKTYCIPYKVQLHLF